VEQAGEVARSFMAEIRAALDAPLQAHAPA
jgi:hypothetical protein